MDPDDIVRAARLVAEAGSLIIAAGAGMGVDSGLPDFRGAQGFWRAYPALGASGLRFEQVASPATFARDPQLAWGFYGHRLALYRATPPHAGHRLLLDWAARGRRPLTVFTSNVDGAFQRAGFDPQTLHECHGTIDWLQCTEPCSDAIWPADALQPDIDPTRCRWRGEVPTCPHCGAVARPNILMFGDGRWLPARTDAQDARQRDWLARQARRPLVIELGAGLAVPTVRHFSAMMVRRGATLLRINLREPEVRPGDGLGLGAGALEALQAIDRVLRGTAGPSG
ncbi:SIR2 family NAD-dependent protein deacylase [Pseudaquabacterium rugosum]|uniref:protein acetyllysine N-acetyltransferase n=1 Tax=Pseudaquabacterium rugosum TaxID=2984194 RepID=A0ABU9B9Z7_9BURK